MKTFLIFYGQFLSSSIARHSMLIVIFLLPRTTRLPDGYGTITHLLPSTSSSTSAAFSSYVVHRPACRIKICTEKSEKSENSHFSHISHVIFLHDKLDKVDQVLLPVCQVCQLCQLCQCIFYIVNCSGWYPDPPHFSFLLHTCNSQHAFNR